MKNLLFQTSCVAFLLSSLISCTESKEGKKTAELTDAEKSKIVQEGSAASKTLMETLGAQLKGAMASGGPEAAMGVCANVAVPMTRSVNDQYANVRVSRISLKNRNPENAPDAADAEVLEQWQSLEEAGKSLPESEVRFNPETGEATFYKPIQVQALCLNCHGNKEALKPGVVAVLNEKYPGDKATGYKEGDLRGAFRVVFEPGANVFGQPE